MPGSTDKSRRYLGLTVENQNRAAGANNRELKLKFLQIAALYRDPALQIDDPEKWRAQSHSREAKQKMIHAR